MEEITLNIRKITNLEKYKIKSSDIELLIPSNATLAQLLNALPKTTHNCEPFGLTLSVCNGDKWSVKYYSHFSKSIDDRYDIQIAKHPETALRLMLKQFIKTGHYKALNVKGKR